jgi:regulator of PEP synthase PpsR (kinase-PPPase family)
MNKIYVVSDGTGRTAEQALKAALAQFPRAEVEIIVRPRIRTEPQARKAVLEVAGARGFIVHTFVTDAMRELIIRLARENNLDTIDLMGPLISRLSVTLATTPTEKPGLFGQLNKSYFRRIETMEFAIKHDDGQRVEDLKKAELVLLGVSRTFKTPISIYLAFKGWFVANVPIGLDYEPPPVLETLPPPRIFCLDTNARELTTLRHARHEYMKGAAVEYADQECIRIELMRARKYFAAHPGWSIVNVTKKPIEEIASEILSLRGSPAKRRDDFLV